MSLLGVLLVAQTSRLAPVPRSGQCLTRLLFRLPWTLVAALALLTVVWPWPTGRVSESAFRVGWRAGSVTLHGRGGLGPGPAGGEKPGAGAPYLVWNPVPAAALRPSGCQRGQGSGPGPGQPRPAVRHSWGQNAGPSVLGLPRAGLPLSCRCVDQEAPGKQQ